MSEADAHRIALLPHLVTAVGGCGCLILGSRSRPPEDRSFISIQAVGVCSKHGVCNKSVRNTRSTLTRVGCCVAKIATKREVGIGWAGGGTKAGFSPSRRGGIISEQRPFSSDILVKHEADAPLQTRLLFAASRSTTTHDCDEKTLTAVTPSIPH